MAFGYAYQYVSGIYLIVGIDFTHSITFHVNTGISSIWKININSNDPTLLLNINIIAILLSVFIDKTLHKLKNIDLEQQLSFDDNQSSIALQNAQVSDTTEAK